MPMLKKREDLTEDKNNETLFALGLSNDFGDLISVPIEIETNNNIEELENIEDLNLEEETKDKLLNEYNNYKQSKSIKEQEKYKKRIKELLK